MSLIMSFETGVKLAVTINIIIYKPFKKFKLSRFIQNLVARQVEGYFAFCQIFVVSGSLLFFKIIEINVHPYTKADCLQRFSDAEMAWHVTKSVCLLYRVGVFNSRPNAYIQTQCSCTQDPILRYYARQKMDSRISSSNQR